LLSIDRIKKIWIWILLIFISLLFLSSNPGKSRLWNPSIKILIEVIAPVQKLIKNSVTFTENLWFKYFALVNTREENEKLKTEIDRLKMENSRYREQLATHERLQQLLNFKNTTEQNVLAAQVIISDPSGWFRSIIARTCLLAAATEPWPKFNRDICASRLLIRTGRSLAIRFSSSRHL